MREDQQWTMAPAEDSLQFAQSNAPAGSPQKMMKGHRGPKSKSGCTSCKVRRVKCDERKPACQNCMTKVLDCVYLPPKAPAERSLLKKFSSKASSDITGQSESVSPADQRASRDVTRKLTTPEEAQRNAVSPSVISKESVGSTTLPIGMFHTSQQALHSRKKTHASRADPLYANIWRGTTGIVNEEQDEEHFLTQVFFQTSTHLFSIYTGSCNPFMRLRQYLSQSKALRLAVQAMAALTISDYNSEKQNDYMDRGLELQRLAYRELSMVLVDPIASLSDATFASVVHIGMTEPWHQLRSNQSGAVHLRTSKVLICQRHQACVPLPPKYLCHLLLYWDLLVSLHSDSSHEGYSTDMLFNGQYSENDPIDYIDPTLGLGVQLAEIIVEMENFLRFCRTSVKRMDEKHHLEMALVFEHRLVDWQPEVDSRKLLGCVGVFETSSLQDILFTSEAYRQTALLLLYRSVPQLLLYHDIALDQRFLQGLASNVMSTLAAISPTSPVCTTHEWILFVAAPDVEVPPERAFVRTRMSGLLEKIGIIGIKEVMDYIEEVWRVIDSGQGNSMMWMDGMHRKQWYPLLG